MSAFEHLLIHASFADIEDSEDKDLAGLRLHVFYRALETMPTLIRGWYESCKDRQLTMSFMSAVTKHFSPILISNEFAVLKAPGAISELEDDNLTIKVVSGAPEVNARYIIDEQPMEISIRLPAEFPLKSVEVKDLGRVGVTENKWRGWIFNLQQMIMSRVSGSRLMNGWETDTVSSEWSHPRGTEGLQEQRDPAL
jgi:hypothetical protein